MDWAIIKQQIEEDDCGKWDLKIPAEQLSFLAGGTLRIHQNGYAQDYRLSEYALTQLCQRLSIPAGYFKRLPAEMQVELANYDLKRVADQSFLLRGKGETIRGVLSDRYVPYNNGEVFEVV
ncbi:MAG: hypothetical protein L0312_00190 [Acidobacteria bacterium]|nr:hypothetical protein [Acidobacteriota bacterium]